MKYDDDLYHSVNSSGDKLGIWIDKDSEDEYKYFIAAQASKGRELEYLKTESMPDGLSIAFSLNELFDLRRLIDEVIEASMTPVFW